MKRQALGFAGVVLLGAVSGLADVTETCTGEGADIRWQRTENGIRIARGNVTRTLEFYGPGALRIKSDLGADYWRHPSLAIVAKPVNDGFDVSETSGTVELTGAEFIARISKATGSVTFVGKGGEVLFREADEPVTLKKLEIDGSPTYEVVQRWAPAEGEGLYGLGHAASTNFNLRGCKVKVVQTNIPAFAPVFSSSKGWMILFDIYSQTIFEDGKDGLSLWSESAPGGGDYYFLYGRDPYARFAEYRRLTGAATLFPKAALGFFQSKERYKSQEELLNAVRRFRELHYPIDFIVQDWQYWDARDERWNAMQWDRGRFPDPKGLCDRLHDELHAHLMVSIWPDFGEDTDAGREMASHKLLFAPPHWISNDHSHVYDAYSQLGRDIYFKHLKKGLLDVGVDAMWMDGSELETRDAAKNADKMVTNIKECGRNALGDFTRYLNTYGLVTVRGNYEGQRRISDRRVFTLTRSAWAGLQRYAALSWSGDTTASWRRLHEEIAGGLGASMSGLAFWTQDTGGFFGGGMGGLTDPKYLELLARWNQFAIFNPVYRWHGTSFPREPYLALEKQPQAFEAFKAAAMLRYRLIPYAYSLMRDAHDSGRPLMRPVFMDYPDGATDRDDAFLFGPFLFSQVVLAPAKAAEGGFGEAEIAVNLPKGADWYDFWEGALHKSAERINKKFALDRFPLYVRAGSVLPVGPAVEWAEQPSEEPMELRVYPGGDAAFSLYEDDGRTYAYEQGEFARIPVSWNDAAKTLTIGAVQGAFRGFRTDRRFKIVLVSPAGRITKTIEWTGAPVCVNFLEH